TSAMAIICNPGAESRNNEIVSIEPLIVKHFERIEKIIFPGTVDGGDVMMVNNLFYIGVSDRTNKDGAKQFIDILWKYGFSGSIVSLEKVLHLKTGVNYLDNSNLLVSGEFIDKPVFESFNKIVIPEHEAYAANSLWINDFVLVPKGFSKSLRLIEEAGYETIVVDVSEFEKLDGGLSCLSLRF
ncbi:arginine deiminase family protein, partial [Bacteroidota bacterium]